MPSATAAVLWRSSGEYSRAYHFSHYLYILYDLYDYILIFYFEIRDEGAAFLLKDTALKLADAEYKQFDLWLHSLVKPTTAMNNKLTGLLAYKFTSFSESFHSVCNKYCPKHDYVQYDEYCRRKTKARLHWNEVRSERYATSPLVFRWQTVFINRLMALM